MASLIPSFKRSNPYSYDNDFVTINFDDEAEPADNVLWSSVKIGDHFKKLLNLFPLVNQEVVVDDDASPASNVLWSSQKIASIPLPPFQLKQDANVGTVAIFGNDDKAGQVIDSGFVINDEEESSNVLWSSEKISKSNVKSFFKYTNAKVTFPTNTFFVIPFSAESQFKNQDALVTESKGVISIASASKKVTVYKALFICQGKSKKELDSFVKISFAFFNNNSQIGNSFSAFCTKINNLDVSSQCVIEEYFTLKPLETFSFSVKAFANELVILENPSLTIQQVV